jgi:hypothetical protein
MTNRLAFCAITLLAGALLVPGQEALARGGGFHGGGGFRGGFGGFRGGGFNRFAGGIHGGRFGRRDRFGQGFGYYGFYGDPFYGYDCNAYDYYRCYY